MVSKKYCPYMAGYLCTYTSMVVQYLCPIMAGYLYTTINYWSVSPPGYPSHCNESLCVALISLLHCNNN